MVVVSGVEEIFSATRSLFQEFVSTTRPLLQKDEGKKFCNKAIVSETRPLFQELNGPKFIFATKLLFPQLDCRFKNHKVSAGAPRVDRMALQVVDV